MNIELRRTMKRPAMRRINDILSRGPRVRSQRRIVSTGAVYKGFIIFLFHGGGGGLFRFSGRRACTRACPFISGRSGVTLFADRNTLSLPVKRPAGRKHAFHAGDRPLRTSPRRHSGLMENNIFTAKALFVRAPLCESRVRLSRLDAARRR